MAVTTGTTTTITQRISVEYTCSHCGARVSTEDTLKASVFSSILIRVNPYEEAAKEIGATIHALNHGSVPERYQATQLRCFCTACGQREPWAKIPSRKVSIHLFWIPFVIAILVAVMAPIPFGWPKFATILTGLIPGFVVLFMKLKKYSKTMNDIRALPQESLPVVRLIPNTYF